MYHKWNEIESGRIFDMKKPEGLYIVEPEGDDWRGLFLSKEGELDLVSSGCTSPYQARMWCEKHWERGQ